MYEYKLPQTVTISSCDELLNQALEVKSNHESIELDSSQVDTIDTAGIQFICSFCVDVNQVTHTNMSDVVKDAMGELGLIDT
jgi:anti-anti-sigma regulatory factor